MSYSFKLLPDEPILIATISASFNQKYELDPYLNETAYILEGLDQPIYYIADVSETKVSIFQDFLTAFNRAFRGAGAIVNHPNLRKPIFVSTDPLIKLGARGLNAEIYGNLSVPVFDTLEEALAYARSLLMYR